MSIPSENIKKPRGFLMFSEGIEVEYLVAVCLNTSIEFCYVLDWFN